MKNIASILAIIIAFSPMAHGQTENGVSGVRTWDAEQDFGPWIKRGKLVYQSVNLKAGRLGAYVYQPGSGNWVLLSGKLDGINLLLSAEISADSVAPFLNEYLARLLLATMATPRSKIVDKEFLIVYARNGDSNSIPKLQGYKSDTKPSIAGPNWTLNFNVCSDQGAIERWLITGRLAPLSIRSFAREIVEPNGAFAPLLETGSDVRH